MESHNQFTLAAERKVCDICEFGQYLASNLRKKIKICNMDSREDPKTNLCTEFRNGP